MNDLTLKWRRLKKENDIKEVFDKYSGRRENALISCFVNLLEQMVKDIEKLKRKI